jgi:cupin superfamily acireductone dioxygenase involved in methionine salvage
MADPRHYELDELVNRPGTYFNPQTEVLVVVDDSPDMDSEIFNMEEYEGADWVQVSDEVPVDEHRRDELLETFQSHHQPGTLGEVEDDEVLEDFDEEDLEAEAE